MPLDSSLPTKKRSRQKIVHGADLFCGAGGTSTGMLQAIEELGLKPKLIAVNHWDVAIATHYANHPDVKHYQSSIDDIKPQDVIPGGRLQLLVASPECTHHSRARGGKPRSDQKRADAWMLMRWIEKLYVENILIENVKEFQEWGPLNADGKPSKKHKGLYFQQFIEALRINYNVEYRVLNCADYGDPTTRERLFIIARRPKHRPIVWPPRTHASRKELAKIAGQPGLFGNTKLETWVAAREIIDWSLEGKSIFGRKKSLSPIATVTSQRGFALVEPFIVKFYGNEKGAESVDAPLSTVTGKDRFGLCIPSLGVVLDIRFRMLQPHELAAAMSFPKEYEFTGNREAKVKQIGNAVPLRTAKVLCKALLG